MVFGCDAKLWAFTEDDDVDEAFWLPLVLFVFN